MRGAALAVLAMWFCATIPALAQDTAGLPLVGVMVTGGAANSPSARLREALAALGDVEGRNLRFDFRFADGDAQRFPQMAEAFVNEKASVIVVFSEAAARAPRTIPLIAVAGTSLPRASPQACPGRAATSPGSA